MRFWRIEVSSVLPGGPHPGSPLPSVGCRGTIRLIIFDGPIVLECLIKCRKIESIKTMASLTITSPKHGVFNVYFDDIDAELVARYHWCIHKRRKFYCVANSGGKQVQMHRLIAGAVMVDHKDGDGLNNRRSNLRPCTNAENLRNRGPQINNKTGAKGVHLCNRSKKFVSKITVDGKIIYLGAFTNVQEASTAYDRAAIKYHGQFARINTHKTPQL